MAGLDSGLSKPKIIESSDKSYCCNGSNCSSPKCFFLNPVSLPAAFNQSAQGIISSGMAECGLSNGSPSHLVEVGGGGRIDEDTSPVISFYELRDCENRP